MTRPSKSMHRIEKWWRGYIGRNAPLLAPIAWLYGLVVWLRNKAYDYLPLARKVDLEVISVGNITLGGSGKTPVVMALAKELSKTKSVAIVTRGYRSGAGEQGGPVVISDGHGPKYPWAFCGDEPYLLAINLPRVEVIVSKDRYRGAKLAKAHGAQVVILDDGFQHRRLHRDRDIVVMGKIDHPKLFPQGELREPLSALKRADQILSDLKYDAWVEKVPHISGKKVGIFSAIAHPERFRQTVQQLGATIVEELVASDHCAIEPIALEQFASRCQAKGADILLCTEKDWVKRPLDGLSRLQLGYVKISLDDPNNSLSKVAASANVRSNHLVLS